MNCSEIGDQGGLWFARGEAGTELGDASRYVSAMEFMQ